MNLNKLILATVALCLTASVNAQGDSIRNGNLLLQACSPLIQSMDTIGQAPNTFEAGYCLGIVGAIVDISNSSTEAVYHSCLPKGMTAGQGVRIVTKYLQSNPDKLHILDSALVFLALKDAFPCKG